jgi:hypothetical protein
MPFFAAQCRLFAPGLDSKLSTEIPMHATERPMTSHVYSQLRVCASGPLRNRRPAPTQLSSTAGLKSSRIILSINRRLREKKLRLKPREGATGTTLEQRRQAGLFGIGLTATFGMLVLVALVMSPAAAQPLSGGIIRPGGAFVACRFSPRISFAADSPSVGLGTSTNLSWRVQTPRGCGYSYSMIVLARPQINLSAGAPQDWAIWTSSIGVTAQPQGSLQVQPAFNTVYMLVVAWGPNNAIYSAPTIVAVSLPRANPKCFDVANPATSLTTAPTAGRAAGITPVRPCRNRITIDANNLAPLLVQALGTSNTTVIVADGIELDLTPYLGGPITIKDGVQLIGERVAEPGKRFQPGPRLFVTPNPNVPDQSHWPNPLLQIDGNNVRISGVRLEGPGAPPDAWRSSKTGETRGIKFIDKINIEIDHNEFYGWNTAAVEPTGVESPTGPGDQVWQMWTSKATADSSGIHYPAGLEPVNIHDNFFHDNFQGDPYDGYGVVASGTHVLIERNVFNGFYHAIAADGCSGSGYRAYRNLVLEGNEKQQAFDAHHRRPADCGGSERAAGHDFDIRWNSFLYRDGPALLINGAPDLGAFVGSNVFAQDHIKDDAVKLGSGGDWGKVRLDGTNLEGVKSWFDASHSSTECDFDGDGINDTFITTGETWWFQSRDQRHGPAPWVYLNTNTLLVENVRLGYFSTDAIRNHVCDVATIDGGYKGGTGQYGRLN